MTEEEFNKLKIGDKIVYYPTGEVTNNNALIDNWVYVITDISEKVFTIRAYFYSQPISIPKESILKNFNINSKELIHATMEHNNKVEHPKYYNQHPSGVECIDIVRYYNFDVGNVIKYLWRAGLKTEEGYTNKQKELEDCKKALFYLKDHINMLEKNINN